MIQTLQEIDSHIDSYIKDIRGYLLQHRFQNYSGRIFFKNCTNNGVKFQYLAMISPAIGEVCAIDLLLMIRHKEKKAYAVYGDYCIEIPLQDAINQFEKTDHLLEIENQTPIFSSFPRLKEFYQQPVYSDDTNFLMQTLKNFAQKKGMSGFSSIYCSCCEETIMRRNQQLESFVKPIEFSGHIK